MKYWLLKSEPNTWSWHDQVKDGPSMWDGKKLSSKNNLIEMKK